MKKVLALALALVMALSMSAMAFADFSADCPFCNVTFDEAGPYNTHLGICPKKPTTTAAPAGEPKLNECPLCHEKFADEALYNAHVKDCKYVVENGEESETVRIDLTVKEILNMIIDLAKSSMTQWGDIESIIIRLVDFVENMGTLAADKAAVLGAVEDLEAAFADVQIPGLDDLLNQLKAKIKAMYAGEKATTVVEETTVVTPPADTGSSAAGIAAFAAISVAAAAAYVCTKKSK